MKLLKAIIGSIRAAVKAAWPEEVRCARGGCRMPIRGAYVFDGHEYWDLACWNESRGLSRTDPRGRKVVAAAPLATN